MASAPFKPAAHCEILGSKISVLSCSEVATLFLNLSNKITGPGYVCISNVHTVVEGAQDPSFKTVTNDGLFATADGIPLVWVSKWYHFLKPQAFPAIHARASGPDILAEVLTLDATRNLRHAFYGSTPDTLKKMQENILRKWPGTQIVCSISPPFRNLTSNEQMQMIAELSAGSPHLIWVGLGAPKQEKWMATHFSKFQKSADGSSPVLVGVGAAFDFFAETKPRAPHWMQRMGLEWFFRLCSEPRRLFRRYAVTNSRFVFEVFRQSFMVLLRKKT